MPYKDKHMELMYKREYRRRNHEKLLEYHRKYRLSHKQRAYARQALLLESAFVYVLDILSPEHKCVKCGFNDTRALHLDHIHGGGSQERSQSDYNINQIYLWIITHPEEAKEKYQILCANCNWIKKWENHEFRRVVNLG